MIYVISDLHGYPFEKLKALFAKAGFCSDDFCYVLGDVIDRGNDGVKILKWLINKPNVELLLGNHEAMMMSCDFLFDEITYDSLDGLSEGDFTNLSVWRYNGGSATIDALALENHAAIRMIVDYLRDAPLYEAVSAGGRDFLLTHSGLGNFAPDKKMSDYTPDELIWNRPQLTDRYYGDFITVFGHTPTVCYGPEFEGRPIVTDTWINVDVGAGYGYPPLLLRLDDMKEFYAD